MNKRSWWLIILVIILSNAHSFAQIDPEKRQLIQLGYNQPLVGRGPLAGYLFYHRNQPNFLDDTNKVLRLDVAPVYLDTELAFRSALGRNTDFAIGIAGGGYANSYFEVRQGKYLRSESFTGHGGEVSASIYHLFNPGQRIPLSGVFRVTPHYTVYERDSDTSHDFVLPRDHGSLNIRSGLRWGGREPTMQPEVGMELSTWYEGQFRTGSGRYGFNEDREMESASHLFWGRALLIYTLPNLHHNFSLGVTAGTSISPDRFSGYRLGGDLPLSSEFPLILPGYYYQEISARRFVEFTGQYTLPLDAKNRWSLTGIGSVANVDYVRGMEQPGHTLSGAGIGIGYRSPNGVWQILASYGYGFDAIRSHGRGGQSFGILCQIDLEARHRAPGPLIDQTSPYKSRGLFQFLEKIF